jgi:hypothetical protein
MQGGITQQATAVCVELVNEDWLSQEFDPPLASVLAVQDVPFIITPVPFDISAYTPQEQDVIAALMFELASTRYHLQAALGDPIGTDATPTADLAVALIADRNAFAREVLRLRGVA